VTFGLGLIAQEQGPTVGLPGHLLEALCQREVAVLGAGDFDIAIARELRAHGDDGIVAGESVVEAGGEESRFEARCAKECLLGKRDAFKGEEFLGVDGLEDGREVGEEMGDLIQIFEADDGKGGGGEAVQTSIAGRAGLSFRCARTGGMLGVGAIRGALFLGGGRLGRVRVLLDLGNSTGVVETWLAVGRSDG
jgi:hypothetical protein